MTPHARPPRRGGAFRYAAPACLALALAGLPGTAAAGTVGQWSGVLDWPRIPIHAMIMPDGRVMTFGATVDDAQGAFDYDLWDPKRGTGADAHLTFPSLIDMNSFCAAQLLQPWNGVAMTAGGNSNTGAATYDGGNLSTKPINATRYPRWYGTMTTMPDGRIAIQGGMVPYDFNAHTKTPELFTPGQGWTELAGATSAEAYGTVHADGRANYVTAWPVSATKLFTIAGQRMFYLDVGGNGAISGMRAFTRPNWGATSSAVMYQPGKILQVGGGNPANDFDYNVPGSRNATLIDITGNAPVVTETAPMAYGRHWLTATVLPTGEVLVTGGSAVDNKDTGVAYAAEIWNPKTGRWRTDASAKVMRLYHSTAILLPDGRVLSGGGGAPGPIAARNAEIYAPAYLFDNANRPAARPAITAAPGLINPGTTFSVTATGPVSRVTLVKNGAVTHGWNNDQRFIELSFRASGNTLSVDAPKDTVIATPGYYMLFVIDQNGVPSEARIVKVPVPSAVDDGLAPGSRRSDTWTAAVGRTRGTLWTARCNDGEVLAGLYGTAGATVGNLGLRCVAASGGKWTANPRSFARGGNDPQPPFTRDCPRDQVVSAMGGQANEGATQLVLTCSPLNAINGAAGGGAKVAAIGNGGGATYPDSACPENGSGYGLYIDYNNVGGRIGMLCRNGGGTATTAAPTPTVPPLPTAAVSLESASDPGYYARALNADTVVAAQAASVADKAATSYTLKPQPDGSVAFAANAQKNGYLRHAWFLMRQTVANAPADIGQDALFNRRAPLAGTCGCSGGACVSYESTNYPGYYVHSRSGTLAIDQKQATAAFGQEASFCERLALDTNTPTGALVSLQSSNYPANYVTAVNGAARLIAPGSTADRQRATFRQVTGLAGQGVSFEASTAPGQFLRHQNFQILQHVNDNGDVLKRGASFLPVAPLAGTCGCNTGQCVSYESVDWRGYYLRHQNFNVSIAQSDGSDLFRQDASFCLAPPLASATASAGN